MQLNPGQQRVLKLLNGPQRNTLVYGGSRSGKTFLFVMTILARAMKAPGSRHVIFRFRQNAAWSAIGLDTLPKVAALCNCPLTSNKQDKYFTLPNKSEIWIAGLDDKERVEKILGAEFVTIYHNEASQIPYNSYLMSETRLAQVCPEIKQRMYVDLNPSGTGHWTYRLFVQHVSPVDPRKRIADTANYAHDFISPKENSSNLSPEYLESLKNLPDRQRRRFYDGEFSAEIDGALWPMDVIDRCRMGHADPLPDMRRVVVAIDPSGTAGDIDERSDDVGIIVAGKGVDGRYYVIEDLTCNEPPAVWASRAVNAYHRHKADRLVAERNFGGAMVEAIVKGVGGKPVNYGEVVASRGKVVRAEPISSFYHQGMVSHADLFPELEDQMSMMTTAGYMGDRSPDRVDAMVWALTELSEGTVGAVSVSREAARAFGAGMARIGQMKAQERFRGL